MILRFFFLKTSIKLSSIDTGLNHLHDLSATNID